MVREQLPDVPLAAHNAHRVRIDGRLTVETVSPFHDELDRIYRAEHSRLFAYIQRLSGEPDLSADIVQDAFVRLQRRGSMPDSPGAWLVTVATNLLRTARARSVRRQLLLSATVERDGSAATVPDAAADEDRARVRSALQRLAPRDQELLSLLAGGYKYREMAAALGLNEASVGTLLSRAKRAFKQAYGATDDPR